MKNLNLVNDQKSKVIDFLEAITFKWMHFF